MKTVILHLSDLHLKENNTSFSEKTSPMAKSISKFLPFDNCIIIISGDITYSGNKEEYLVAKRSIDHLVSCIESRFPNLIENGAYTRVKVYVVPGNHDIEILPTSRTISDIQEYYDTNTVENMIDKEKEMFSNFYEFAEHYNCFRRDAICEQQLLKINDVCIQINLVNSALFSTLKASDKELHYFPNRLVNKLMKVRDADIVFTVMHHRPEWFEWNSRGQLKNMIKNDTDIIFLGHDHSIETQKISSDGERSFYYSVCGQVSSENTSANGEYNIHCYDHSNKALNVESFCWMPNEQIYISKKTVKNQFIETKKTILTPVDDFIKRLNFDRNGLVSANLMEYFVFPALVEESSSSSRNREYEKKYIETLSELEEMLNEKKYLKICGDDNSGKTSLLNYLFLFSIQNHKFTPLLLDAKSMNDRRIDDLIKRAFEDQYGSDLCDFEKYKQLLPQDRILLIDDYGNISKKKMKSKLIEMAKEFFGFIIVTEKDKEKVDVVQTVKNELEEDIFLLLKICPFYVEKRNQLIKNMCKCNGLNSKRAENVIHNINGYVKNQFSLFRLSPDFIIQFTNYYINQYDTVGNKSEDIFSAVFETNINNSLLNYVDKSNIDEYLILLGEIAYYIHFNKIYPISIQTLKIIIIAHNQKYGSYIDHNHFLRTVKEAKIFGSDQFEIDFSNSSYLAYFVANYLSVQFLNDPDTSRTDFEYVTKNICFGINDTILLFLIFKFKSQRIILQILNEVNVILNDWEEYDIDKKNIAYLENHFYLDDISAPNDEMKKQANKNENFREEELSEDAKIKMKSLYDYDENQIDQTHNKILRAIKYTGILARSIPSFRSIIEIENKKLITSAVYNNPSKLTYKLLKPIDDNYDEIIHDLIKYADFLFESNLISKELTRRDIENILYDLSISIILGAMNQFAFLITDRHTIEFLKTFVLDNTNNKIFDLLVSENYGDTEEFSKKATYNFDRSKDRNVKMMIKRIVQRHMMRKEIAYNQKQRLESNILKK